LTLCAFFQTQSEYFLHLFIEKQIIFASESFQDNIINI